MVPNIFPNEDFRHVDVKLDNIDMSMIVFNLKVGLKKTKETLHLLQCIKNGTKELEDVRDDLPAAMRHYDEEGLATQLESWISLVMQYKFLINKFKASDKEYRDKYNTKDS